MTSSATPTNLTNVSFEELVAEMIRRLGDDPERSGMRNTPERVAESMAFLTKGYGETPPAVIGDALFEESHESMVLVKDIEIYSLCEHHMLPFFGKAHVAYIPNGKILGLSKIARIVEVFARRFQVQERLTEQVAQAVWEGVPSLHDDARGPEAELEDDHVGNARDLSGRPSHARRVPATHDQYA